ncbi:MAG: methylated-DNA--[protein]-cysteine S-methyltransferase [Pedobacter sp.]|uniref:bifunctional helix-turn-helix domain-containing protein/methylated-DNA--[protein]-cysteine S-methyltransferase n=1 Tax=Pedobacter sp. TaxID=1411316 RepID=UPI00280A02C3|nr:methylated-DNA--[protein]-cysteine S-methyltransferase [Pedobacter sp.]MDQ8004030.1 methylated-DNA--[protein]-cysteine S-methyltransferase [Pedobacter sp.]
MNTQEELNYERIARAIDYIKTNFKSQPNLDEVAEKVNLSPFHFQRLFTEWAGTSPKKFLQYVSVNYAKKLLQTEQANLFDVAFETGLSGTSRLHDLFVNIEGMTPAEYKNGGIELTINYQFSTTHFGSLLTASTAKGVCYMAFYEDETIALQLLKAKFPSAKYLEKSDDLQQNAMSIFRSDWSELKEVKLHLKGTDFQLKVWEALLKIPMGKLSTYGKLANEIGNPSASRAVGTAIGSNPIAFLIPCHRVIQSGGTFGGYMWGNTRKTAIIGWEQAFINENL